ncbi:MAG: hypothetical protein HEQ13_11330 [Dolichospermum sp. DEX189]|nr:hypothetical protein [Dolichospermum sp. DEX189]
MGVKNCRYGKARGTHARGKSEEGLGDFTFLYTDWFYCVHLLKYHSIQQQRQIQFT